MVLGPEWSQFGVWLRGEFLFAAQFYEEGQVYCGAAGHDCALVCCDGDCEFGLFLSCSAFFLGCFIYGVAGACASLSDLLLKELEGRSFGHWVSLSKYMGFAIIILIPMCMRHLEELVTSLQSPITWFLLNRISISFCIISGLPLLDTGFHSFLLLVQLELTSIS